MGTLSCFLAALSRCCECSQLCLLAQIGCRRLAFSSSTSPGASAGRVSSASVLTLLERKSIRFLRRSAYCHWDYLLALDLRFRSLFGDVKLCFFVRPSAGCRIANANRGECPLLAQSRHEVRASDVRFRGQGGLP